VHVPRHFATIWHCGGVFLRQICHPLPLDKTLDRLESRGLATPVLQSTTNVYRIGPIMHTTATCPGPGAEPYPARVRELIESPSCQKCSWQLSTSVGKLLQLASWWFSLADLTEHELPPTWRSAMLLHAACGSPARLTLDASSTHLDVLDPLRRQVLARADMARAAALAHQGVASLHRSVAALGYEHQVSASQARQFATWAAETGTLQLRRSSNDVWDEGLAAALGPCVQVLATPRAAPLTWATSMVDATSVLAASEFIPHVILSGLSNGVLTGSIPELTAAGLVQLGFDVVPAPQCPQGVLVMAAQLFDQSRATELGDLATALAAANAITS